MCAVYRPFGVLRPVLLRPGGGIPENEIVVKEKSKIHLPVLGLVPLGSCSGAGREPKMGPLEELDDPGARQPEREVTEHPTSVVRKNCEPSRIPLEGS